MVISIAPMMDWTDRHCRYLHRLLSKHAVLYTEMVTAKALIFGASERLLTYNSQEHPVVLQLGGSDPAEMAHAVKIAEPYQYDEYNINVGCPSDRVVDGAFGACLMAKPEVVAACVKAMRGETDRPVTVKTRLGIDDLDNNAHLHHFVETVAAAGCTHFIIHARKAWLNGLSPKENREIPPLQYDRVYALKQAFPSLTITLNGGVTDWAQTKNHLGYCDGVMLGRAAYQKPALLREIDSLFFGETTPSRPLPESVLEYKQYVDRQLAVGVPLHILTRPLLGLYESCTGARAWRRILTEEARDKTSSEVLLKALAVVA
jgi:tRNA-dihydrouridine synthase A